MTQKNVVDIQIALLIIQIFGHALEACKE